jgi:hypothetical protein
VRDSVSPAAMKLVVITAALCCASAPASGIGSVISSFRLSGYADPYANGIYAGDNYLSAIYCTAGRDYFYRYRFNGSLVNSYSLVGTSTPRGGDAAHLGNGYISLVDAGSSRLFIFRAAGGSPVASFAVSGPGSGTLQDVMWTGTYYEVTDHLGNGRFNRYTSAGSFVEMTAYNGWPASMTSTGAAAFSDIAGGRSGSYLVASSRSNGQPSCVLDVAGPGSLVATFAMPPFFAAGGCCGRSSKLQKYGTTYWTAWIVSNAVWCYEVDVDGILAAAVTPASLGKVKAIYR